MGCWPHFAGLCAALGQVARACLEEIAAADKADPTQTLML